MPFCLPDNILELVPIYAQTFKDAQTPHEHVKDLPRVANRWAKLLQHIQTHINPMRVKEDKMRKQLERERVHLGKGYGLLHSLQNRPENPWQMDREFAPKAAYWDVIVTLYDEPECEGNAEQKGAINCDGYCWPMTDPPKSVLLEAVYNSEHAPKGRVVLTDRDDIFDDVDRKGPRVEFFGGPRQGTNDSGVQHDFACAPDTVLAHGVIPPHHNASCFNLEDQITSRISGMIVRHLEVCPWEAERYRRVFWYKFPDEIIHHKYDWEKLRYEEYPEWAFMGLGGEPREVIPQAWTYTTEKEIDKAFIPWLTDTFDPEGFDASDMGPPLFHEGAPLYGAQIPVGMDFSNKMEDQPYQPQKEGTSMTGGVASGGGVLGGASGGGASGGGAMGGGALGMLGQAVGVGGLLGGL